MHSKFSEKSARKWLFLSIKASYARCLFYGIIIKMFFADHAPAHFHAEYGEYKAMIDIKKLILLEGTLPRRALGLVLDWAEIHQSELLKDWELCQSKQQPNKIKPLN